MFDGLRVNLDFDTFYIGNYPSPISVLTSPRATTNLAKIVELDRVTSPFFPSEVCGRPFMIIGNSKM